MTRVKLKLKGIIPALITPFTPDHEINQEGLRENVRFLLENGVHGLLAIGGTGEFTALSDGERKRVIDIVVDETNGKVPVLVGILSPGIGQSLDLARYAEDAGADAVMLLTPYYVHGTEKGIYDYYKFISDKIAIPIVLYNIPPRTQINLSPSLVSRLVEIENIVGIKQCNRDLSQTSEIIRLVRDKMIFSTLTGEDDLMFPSLMLGARGGVLASANLVPHIWIDAFRAFEKGDIEGVRNIHFKLAPLFKALFAETNPGPLKEALRMVGKPSGPVRLPLRPVSDETKKILREAMIPLELF